VVSDAGVVAFAVGNTIHVVRPGGGTSQIETPGAWPFFDPIAPERLRLVTRREGVNALENAVGGAKSDPKFSSGPLRSVAVSHDGRWLAATVKTKSHALGVVVCDHEGTIAGWTGPIFGRRSVHAERAFCAFRGRTLVVGTEHGDVGVYEVPA